MSLRLAVLAAGQDVRKCKSCADCAHVWSDDQDISLEMLIELVKLNDEEALTSRTLWSEGAFDTAQFACSNGIDLQAVILALRQEAIRLGANQG
jgi:heterodisulfide reductase subunit C